VPVGPSLGLGLNHLCLHHPPFVMVFRPATTVPAYRWRASAS
jgi:hypothetical protein